MSLFQSFHGQMSDHFRTAVFIILSGGFQDAYTYTCRGKVFANAQTGNIVLLSTALFQGQWQTVVKYLIPLIAFTLGIAGAECVHLHLKNCSKLHWRQMILLAEILLLLLVGLFPAIPDALANATVSFVCALQVQSFHKVRGQAYASTMCIGNLRAGTEALCTYLRDQDKKALKKSRIYFGVILIFAVGAGLGSLVSLRLGSHAILVCCPLLFISFLMMFVPEKA